MKKFILVFAAMLGMGMLVGCGGGGGGGGAGIANTSSLSGTAAKGIIKNGVVTAYQLKSDGSKGIEVGSAVTDPDGTYNLDLKDYDGGMILVEITPSTDPAKKTQMKCDDFADARFGQWIDLDSGFKMAAVIDPEGGSVSLQITPLTNMAASRALATTPVTKESVAKANNEVSQIVGIDIVHAKIVDITDPAALADATPEGKQYALANAGLAGFLSPGAAGETLAGNIDNLAAAFADGKLGNSDGIDINVLKGKIEDAATAANSKPDIKSYCQNAITAVTTIATTIGTSIDNGVYDPEPSKNAGKPAIEQAKALLQDGRTFVEQIIDNYEKPIDALDVDADTIDALLNNQVQIMAQMLGESVEQTLEYLNTKTTVADELADPQTYTVPINDSANQSMGTLTVAFTSNASGVSMTINGTLTGSKQTVNITKLTLATNITADDIKWDSEDDTLITSLTTKNVNITASGYVGNDVASIALADVALSVTASEPVAIDFTENSDNDGKEKYLTGASFKGDVTIKTNQIKTNASFEGQADIELVSLNQNIEYADVPVSLKKIAVDGTFSSDTGTFEAGVTLNVDNAAAFDTFGFLDYDDHVEVSNQLSFNDLSQASKDFLNGKIDDCKEKFGQENPVINFAYFRYMGWEGDQQAMLHMDGNEESQQLTFDVPDGLKTDLLASDDADPEDIVDSELYYFTSNSSDGNWDTQNVSAYGVLELKDFENADYFVKGNLTITASVKVPDMSPLSATASVTRSQLRGGDVSLTLTNDGQSYTVDATSENLEAANAEATITLTNPGGVKFVIKGQADENGDWDADTIEGSVSVNGEPVGTVDVSNDVPLVRYDDGTFESIY